MPFEFYPYQKRWLNDTAKLKIALKGRQIGITTAEVFRAAKTILKPNNDYIYLSRGERLAKRFVKTVRGFLRVVAPKFGIKYSASKTEIEIEGGSTLYGLPSDPDAIRSFTGHITLDEFAFHKQGKAMLGAAIPAISRGYTLSIISTPAGKAGPFYEIWQDAEARGFKSHLIDIYTAIKDGYKFDLSLRLAMDADAWAQEFECAFIDGAFAFIPIEIILEAIDDECDAQFGIPLIGGYPHCTIGIDIGRRRDLTAIHIVERIDKKYVTRDIIEMEKQRFGAQYDKIMQTIERCRPLRVCIDCTGIGMQLAEQITEKHGSLIESIWFTGAVKAEMATAMKRLYETNRLAIPNHHRLVTDTHSIKKTMTAAGNDRYDADRNEGSHADHFWAHALAIHGQEGIGSGIIEVASSMPRESSILLRGY